MNNHSSMRLFEWMAAMMMIGIAIIIMRDPRAISFGGFVYMTRIGLTPPVLGSLLLFGGGMRAVALWHNGLWPTSGPRCRAAGALGGCIIWAQMLIALAQWSEGQGYLSIGVSVYLFLAVGDFISVIRAATDVVHKEEGKREVANGRSEQRR